MKRVVLALAILGWGAGMGVCAPEGDPVESGLREAYKLYQDKKYGEVSARLREVLKVLEGMEGERVSEILPAKIADWESGDLKREDLAVLGGGLSLSREYYWGVKTVTVKLVKDSPLLKGILPLLQNKELIELSGRKTHTIFGETAVMENERKLQLAIDQTILVEVTGNQHAEQGDIVELTRKLDVKQLKQMN